MNIQYLVAILRPKSALSWLLLFLSVFMCGVMFGPQLKLLKGWLVLFGAVSSIIGVASILPQRWLTLWEDRHHALRGFILGFFAYVVTVSIGFRSELYSLRVWMDLLFFLEGSPFTSFHSAALSAAAFIYTTQCYNRPTPPPTDSQTVRSGQTLISYEQAKQRIDDLFRP